MDIKATDIRIRQASDERLMVVEVEVNGIELIVALSAERKECVMAAAEAHAIEELRERGVLSIPLTSRAA